MREILPRPNRKVIPYVVMASTTILSTIICANLPYGKPYKKSVLTHALVYILLSSAAAFAHFRLKYIEDFTSNNPNRYWKNRDGLMFFVMSSLMAITFTLQGNYYVTKGKKDAFNTLVFAGALQFSWFILWLLKYTLYSLQQRIPLKGVIMGVLADAYTPLLANATERGGYAMTMINKHYQPANKVEAKTFAQEALLPCLVSAFLHLLASVASDSNSSSLRITGLALMGYCLLTAAITAYKLLNGEKNASDLSVVSRYQLSTVLDPNNRPTYPHEEYLTPPYNEVFGNDNLMFTISEVQTRAEYPDWPSPMAMLLGTLYGNGLDGSTTTPESAEVVPTPPSVV